MAYRTFEQSPCHPGCTPCHKVGAPSSSPLFVAAQLRATQPVGSSCAVLVNPQGVTWRIFG